jgi:cytochrome c
MFMSDCVRLMLTLSMVLLSGCETNAISSPAPTAPANDVPALGQRLSEREIAAIDLTILPDGVGLPEGRGTVRRGAEVFAQRCAACHGEQGRGGIAGMPRLTGGVGSLATREPLQTMNSYWPFATTAFDYIRRAMPPDAPQSLKSSDVYAVTAYILSVDGIVAPDAELDANSLPQVRMPNRDGFVRR